jgi:phosphohistidine phosphatase
MKRLYIIRHAKSSWEEPGLGDFNRPLLKKGIARTKLVIQYFIDHGIATDLILSSPATRAVETARLVAKGIGYPVKDIRTEHKIYEGPYDLILDLIYETPMEVGSLMIFGHNPTVTNLANLFLHPGIEMIPTSGVVCIGFKTDRWNGIPSAEAVLEFQVSPKILK